MKTTLPWYSGLQLLPSYIHDPWSPPTLSIPYDPPLHWPSDSDKCAAITGDREEKYHLVCPMIIKYLLSTKVAQKLEIARVSNQKSEIRRISSLERKRGQLNFQET